MSALRQTLKRAFPPLAHVAAGYRRLRKRLRALRLRRKSRAEVFTGYFESNQWADAESRSGAGSNAEGTRVVRDWLPGLLRELEVARFLDLPCGDFYWMSKVDLGQVDYIGGDIVAPLIAANAASYGGDRRHFLVIDLCRDPLPAADLVLCRDALVHLSNANALSAIDNVVVSGARYLLTTTFPETTENVDIVTGLWRPLNMCRPPFDFPPPMRIVHEGAPGRHGRNEDKSLALWRVSDLRRRRRAASPRGGPE